MDYDTFTLEVREDTWKDILTKLIQKLSGSTTILLTGLNDRRDDADRCVDEIKAFCATHGRHDLANTARWGSKFKTIP